MRFDSLAELFEGAEVVWAVWAVAILILIAGAVRVARCARRPSLRALAADEHGGSYTLSYVMAIPVYLFFLCMAYEATWLLIAKIGTLYAAHAGARSAVVWESMEPADTRDNRIEQSVTMAMAPFATSSEKHLASAGGAPPEAYVRAEEFVLAYRGYSSASAAQPPPRARPYRQTNTPSDTLRRYYLVAAARTTYRYDADPNPGGQVTMTVTYRAPLRIPGPARWLGFSGSSPEWVVTSRATLPNEAADTPDRTIGIGYRSGTRMLPW